MRADWRFWWFGALLFTAAGCNGSFPPRATPANDWTQSATIPHSAPAKPFGVADKYLAKKNFCCDPVHGFTGEPDGSGPQSIVASGNGVPNLVGTTITGGETNNGALYGLTEAKKGSWQESVLYSFAGSASGDGSAPVGISYRKEPCCPVYVVTEGGGTSGNGTFNSFDPNHDWDKTFTYSFGGTPDGAIPIGNPIVDKSGNIYGTTEAGGAYGLGAVYRMQPEGSSYSEAIGWSFGLDIDGASPYGGLIMDKKGALYGTTYVGGSSGEGTVFKLTPSSTGFTEAVLHSFQGPPYDGSRPTAGACGGPGTSIYGTTEEGGTQNLGTVYKLTGSGTKYKETVIWNFGSVSGDGAYPYGGVIVDKKGAIFGTTIGGGSAGSSGLGTVFSLTPSGSTYKETVYSLTGANGAYPRAAPSIGSKSRLFVTTSAGGTKGDGMVLTSNSSVDSGLWTSVNWSGCV